MSTLVLISRKLEPGRELTKLHKSPFSLMPLSSVHFTPLDTNFAIVCQRREINGSGSGVFFCHWCHKDVRTEDEHFVQAKSIDII